MALEGALNLFDFIAPRNDSLVPSSISDNVTNVFGAESSRYTGIGREHGWFGRIMLGKPQEAASSTLAFLAAKGKPKE
jgi:hypothetical protein